jgi:hypothetical protein
LPLRGLLRFAWLVVGSCALAQTVEPVISEYQLKADGKFALTNGTLAPMVVVLEPKSFSQVPTGSPLTYTPFTRSNPMSGASLLLLCDIFMSGGNGFRTDTLNMEIDLEDLPQLPAGTYTGTLYLQAQML